MRVKPLVMAGAAVLMAAVNPAAAQERITLQEAVARSLQKNNLVKAAEYQAEASRAGATAATLHYLPSVTLEESWTRSNVPVSTFMMKLNQGRFANQDFIISNLNNPSPVSDFKTSVTLEQPLLAPGAWAGGAAARRGADRQGAITELVRQQVAFQVFQQYLAVHAAKAYLHAAEKALEEARESRRQAVARLEAGLGLKSDELRAVTHLAAMEQQQITAVNNVSLARMQLALTTGGQPDDTLDVADIQPLPQPASVEGLVSRALKERRDLQAAERGYEQAEAAVFQARSGYLPTVGAFGSWQMNDATTPLGRDHDAWAVGVTLRWNVFDGFRTWHADGQARAVRSAAAEQLEQTRKEIRYQIHEAWKRRQEAEKRHAVAATARVAAEEAVRLLTKRFENGLATMVELLDAQSALNQARANLVESEAYLQLAMGRLYERTGIFLKEVR